MNREFTCSRRCVLRHGAAGVAAVAASAIARPARPQEEERVDPSDPLAQQFMYVEDASNAPPEARAENAFCYNCQYFMGEGETGYGPCVIFGNRLVAAQGWCNAWIMRAA